MMSENGSDVITYNKKDSKWQNLRLILVYQFTYSLASYTVVSARTYIPKIEECCPFWVIYFGNVQGMRF